MASNLRKRDGVTPNPRDDSAVQYAPTPVLSPPGADQRGLVYAPTVVYQDGQARNDSQIGYDPTVVYQDGQARNDSQVRYGPTAIYQDGSARSDQAVTYTPTPTYRSESGFAKQGGIYRFAKPTDQQGQMVAMRLFDLTTGATGADNSIDVVFDINPENIDHDSPTRVTTQQTIGGGYQDNWGPGIERIVISGHTGWRKKTADGRDGFEFLQALWNLHRRYQDICGEHDSDLAYLEILLPPGPMRSLASATVDAQGNRIAGQFGFYRVSSDRFQRQRNTTNPLLFRYSWELTILEDLLETHHVDPSKRFILTPGDLTSDPFGAAGGQTPAGTILGLIANAAGAVVSLGGNSNTATRNDPAVGAGDTPPLTFPGLLDPPAVGSTLGQQPGTNPTPSTPVEQLQINAAYVALGITGQQPRSALRQVTMPQGVTLSQLAAQYGMTATELKVYAIVDQLPVPPDSGPATGVQVVIPPQDFIDSYRGVLIHTSGEDSRHGNQSGSGG